MAAATSLGLVMAVLLGGVAADRFPKRAVLIGVEVVRTAVPVLTGVLALAGGLQLWQLATLAFVVGAAGGFYYPTWSAVVPVLLPADELLAANGIEGMLRPLAQQAAGPALAGLLVAAFSPQVALLGAGVVYMIALLPLVAMRPVAAPGREADDGQPSVRRQLAEGFAYLVRTAGCSPPWSSRPCTGAGGHGPDRGAAALRGQATGPAAGPAPCRSRWPPSGSAARSVRCWSPRSGCHAGT